MVAWSYLEEMNVRLLLSWRICNAWWGRLFTASPATEIRQIIRKKLARPLFAKLCTQVRVWDWCIIKKLQPRLKLESRICTFYMLAWVFLNYFLLIHSIAFWSCRWMPVRYLLFIPQNQEVLLTHRFKGFWLLAQLVIHVVTHVAYWEIAPSS